MSIRYTKNGIVYMAAPFGKECKLGILRSGLYDAYHSLGYA